MSDTLTMNEVLALHAAALEAFGGMPGVRDEGLLDSALAQPLGTFDGRSLFTSHWESTAALGYSLVLNHPFVDGNKRVGFAAMAIVLRRRGFEVICDPSDGEQLVLAIAQNKLTRTDIAKWLESHSRQLR